MAVSMTLAAPRRISPLFAAVRLVLPVLAAAPILSWPPDAQGHETVSLMRGSAVCRCRHHHAPCGEAVVGSTPLPATRGEGVTQGLLTA